MDMNKIEKAKSAVLKAEYKVELAKKEYASFQNNYTHLGCDMAACFALGYAEENLEKAKILEGLVRVSK